MANERDRIDEQSSPAGGAQDEPVDDRVGSGGVADDVRGVADDGDEDLEDADDLEDEDDDSEGSF